MTAVVPAYALHNVSIILVFSYSVCLKSAVPWQVAIMLNYALVGTNVPFDGVCRPEDDADKLEEMGKIKIICGFVEGIVRDAGHEEVVVPAAFDISWCVSQSYFHSEKA